METSASCEARTAPSPHSTSRSYFLLPRGRGDVYRPGVTDRDRCRGLLGRDVRTDFPRSARSASANESRPLRADRARRARNRGFRERRWRSRSSSSRSGTRAARGWPCFVTTTASWRHCSTYSLNRALTSAMDASFTKHLLAPNQQPLALLHPHRDDNDAPFVGSVEGTVAIGRAKS